MSNRSHGTQAARSESSSAGAPCDWWAVPSTLEVKRCAHFSRTHFRYVLHNDWNLPSSRILTHNNASISRIILFYVFIDLVYIEYLIRVLINNFLLNFLNFDDTYKQRLYVQYVKLFNCTIFCVSSFKTLPR